MRYRDEDWLREQYHEKGRSTYEMADECGVCDATIRKYMDRHDIERGRRGQPEQEVPIIQATRDGYERWLATHGDGQDRVYVHRLLAVAEFGFEAVAGQDVHHVDGIPWHNVPGNLLVLGHAEHTKLHQNDG